MSYTRRGKARQSESEAHEKTVLNKEAYRERQDMYRQWNVAKERARARYEGTRSSAQAWADYKALWEFAQKLSRKKNRWARREKLESFQRYYASLRRFEAWRRNRAEKS